jgi:heme/copper-type cytochrome/quinol oxidase subunit 3
MIFWYGLAIIFIVINLFLSTKWIGDTDHLSENQGTLAGAGIGVLVGCIFLGYTYYLYIKENIHAFEPSQVIISFITFFIAVIAIGVSLLVKQ